jgi:GTPase SAR1 family protein
MLFLINEETAQTFITELIQNNIDKLIKGVTSIGKDTIANIKIKMGTAFTDYLTTSTQKYSFTKTILYRHTPVYLYQFYVDVDLESHNELIQSSKIENILNRSNKVLLVGTGGTGKSTLIKHLFLNAVESEKYIPIFVELREINDLDDLKSFDILAFIFEKLSNLNFSLEKQYFMNAVKQGQFVFFLDGFDELKHEYRNTISKQIVKISDKYTNNYFIVSSRPDRNFVTWNNFIELKMNPLSKMQCLQLIDNLDIESSTKVKFKKLLDDKLYEKHQTFLSNPLLLTIMLMTYSQSSDIPEKMCVFYEQAFNALYSNHDATKEGGFKRFLFSNNMPLDIFKDIISAFSIQSYLDHETRFSDTEINDYLIKSKKILGIEFDEKLLKKDLINSVCILFLDGDKYVYTHRSFQEYFTAYYISRAREEIQIKLMANTPKYYYADIVYDLLFEMIRDRVEKYFIYPNLEKIYSESNYKSEVPFDSFINNLKNTVVEFNIDKKNDKYIINNKYNDRHIDYGNNIGLLAYVYRNYHKLYSDSDNIEGSLTNKDYIFNTYFPDISEKVAITLEELEIKVEGKINLISLLSKDYYDYIFAMEIFPLLLEESDKRDKNIADILFLN